MRSKTKRLKTLPHTLFLALLATAFLTLPNENALANGKKDENVAADSTASSVSSKKKPDTVFITTKTRDGYKKRPIEGGSVAFNEVWGWVVQGRESELTSSTVVTDVGYFAASIDTYGHLTNIPKRSAIKTPKVAGKRARVHLVLVSDSKSLTHFILDPKFNLTERLLGDILAASTDFDGVQVDYELIPAADFSNFMNFIKRLAAEVHKLGKVFSICVPARTRLLRDDAFPYAAISKFSDRVVVMAYDEHWSTSAPGPIASVAWCRNVAKYAVTVVPKEKLVMGLPFYGRTWSNEKVAQGWYYSGVKRIIRQYDSDNVRYEADVPTVKLRITAKVTCYFEDAYSTVKKLRLYSDKGISNVAFWRIGQEDPDIWRYITLKQE